MTMIIIMINNSSNLIIIIIILIINGIGIATHRQILNLNAN